jgi:ATP-binding cassette, subfamily B, bacterial PglK
MFAAVRLTLGRMSRGERRHFNALLIGRSATAIFDIVGVLLIGLIGAAAAGALDSSTSQKVVFGIDLSVVREPRNLFLLAIVTLCFFVLKALLAIWLTRLMTSFVARVEARTATELTERILYSSLSKLETWTRSELTYSITYSMNSAFTRLLTHYATLVTEGFLLICIAVVLLVVSPVTMAIVVVYFGIIGLVIQALVGKRQQRAGLKLADSTVKSTDEMTEAVAAFREIFTLGRQDHFVRQFGTARKDMADSAGNVQFVMALPRYIVETSLLLGTVALIGSQLAINDTATAAATLGIFLTAGVRIMASLLPLQTAAGSIRQVSSEADLAHRLLADYSDTVIPVRAAHQESAPDAGGLGVRLRDVSFTYATAASPALNKVDFEAKPGEYVAIVGASGAGKSTLADLLLGLLVPESGTIELDGATPRQLDVDHPGSVAYVPQNPGLVSGSIAENVALGHAPDDIDYDRVEWALGEAGLGDHVRQLSEGARTSVGKQTSALSGGQVQRLGLARALYTMPRLLVLDEATSALDAESEAVVGDSLRRLYGKVTLVVIAHRLSTVQHADTVHVMEEGKIIAAGPFAHLLKTVPVVAHYAELMSLDEKP